MTVGMDVRRVRDADWPISDSELEGENSADLRAWWGALRRHKFTMVLVVLAITIGAYFVVDGITPQYSAVAEVLIEGQSSRVVEFDSVVEGPSLEQPAIGSQVEILQSRSLASRVIDELALMDDPEFNPTLVPYEPSLWERLNPKNWLPEPILDRLGMAPEPVTTVETPEEKEERIRRMVINQYLSRLTVEAVSFTYVIAITFTSEDARKAALIANTTAELYILDQLEAKFEATAQANDWLSERLETLRQDVIAADNALTAYQLEHGLGGSERQSLIEQQLTDANSQLMEARADRVAAQAQLQQMRQLVERSGPASVGAVLESGLIQGLRAREAEARRELAELSTRYGDLHPEIINTKAEIDDLVRTIDEEVAKVLQNLENEVEIAAAREASVRQSVSELQDQFNTEQSADVGRLELERQAEAMRLLYDTMLARFKEVAEQEEIQEPDARIISTAVPPGAPSWPKKKLLLAGAFVFSIMIAIGLVVVIELLNTGFRTIEDVERVLGQRGLSEVPTMSGVFKTEPENSVLKNQISGFAEAVRSLSTSLILSNVDNPPKLIAVASTLPGEGKTSVAVALARLMSMGKRTVLLIDGDLRKPRVHRAVGLSRSPGLSDAIAHDVPLLEAVRPESASGLHILRAGSEVPNPQDLLQSKKAKAIFEQMRKAYDIVIIDTPAIMPVSDGQLLTNMADKTIFLVRWENTPRKVAKRGLQKILASGADLAGIVLTRVNRKKQAGYGAKAEAYYYGRY